MTDLSPAAQAVWEAFIKSPMVLNHQQDDRNAIAAALRAAVEQVLPEDPRPTPRRVEPGGTRMYHYERMGRWEERQGARQELLAIAAELEGVGDG